MSKLASLTHGFRCLLCAVLEQAVYDYQALDKAGIVKNGAILRLPSQNELFIGMDHIDIKNLIDLLTTDSLDRMLNLLPVEISADGIRRVLGIKPLRNSEHRRVA